MGRVRTGNPVGRARKHPLETIAEIYATGASAAATGKLLGMHHATVLYALKQLGVERRKNGQSRPGMTAKRLARVARDEQIKRLYIAGHSSVTIAERIGLNPDTVTRVLNRDGVPMRSRGTRYPKHRPMDCPDIPMPVVNAGDFTDYARYRTEYRKAKNIERMFEILDRRRTGMCA